MKRRIEQGAKLLLSGILGFVLSVGTTAQADHIYAGSLEYTAPGPADAGDGLSVGGPAGQWDDETITFFWTATDGDRSYPGYTWKYEYRILLGCTDHGFSHVNIEVSEGFDGNSIAGLVNATIDCIGTQGLSGVANQGMPEELYAVKFNPPEGGVTDWTFSFFSNRAPVWGDFYVRNGGKAGVINHAFNYNMAENGTGTGFLSPDVDPEYDPGLGTADNHYFYHILRPDTHVPEPGTLALVGTGVLGLIGIIYRRRMK